MRSIARLAALAFFAALPLIARPAAAQEVERTARNAVYLELGGSAYVYSLNYDRLLTDDVSARVGVMVNSSAEDFDGSKRTVFVVPAGVARLWGNGPGRVETGLGVVVANADFEVGDDEKNFRSFFGTAVLGYRYQPLDGGLMFRVGFTPLFSDDAFIPWGGVSIGLAF